MCGGYYEEELEIDSKEKLVRAYVKEMEEYILWVWNDLPTRGEEWEQTLGDLRFAIGMCPFIPTNGTLAESMGESDYDFAYVVCNTVINDMFEEE